MALVLVVAMSHSLIFLELINFDMDGYGGGSLEASKDFGHHGFCVAR